MKKRLLTYILTAAAFFQLMSVSSLAAVPPFVSLVPDYNRDGVIDYKDEELCMENTALDIWINDDRDGGDDDRNFTPDKENCPGGEGQPDYLDDVINGECDLIDFFPVCMEFEDDRPFGRIVLTSDSLNAVFTENEASKAGEIYSSPMYAGDGDTPIKRAKTVSLEGGYTMTDEDVRNIRGRRILLYVEGTKVGKSELTVTVYAADDTELAKNSLAVNVWNVEDMYRTADIRNGMPELSEPAVGSDGDGVNIVFVPGESLSDAEVRGEMSEVFKKLWVSGSHASYTAVRWDDGEGLTAEDFAGAGLLSDTIPAAFNHQAVKNAFDLSGRFTEICDSFSGKLVLIGHSAGNYLISSAVEDHGLAYTDYFMLNSTVPSEAYDASAENENMIPAEWAEIDPSLRASRWSSQFEENDFRSTVSWKGRFSSVTNALNYYNEDDSVLMIPEDRQSIQPDGFKEVMSVFSNHPYAATELYKGTIGEEMLLEFFGKQGLPGGWEMSENEGEYGRTNPKFALFRNEDLFRSELMPFDENSPSLRAELLAFSVPAESAAAGSCAIPVSENISLRQERDNPEERIRGFVDHYRVIDGSLYETGGFYEDFVSRYAPAPSSEEFPSEEVGSAVADGRVWVIVAVAAVLAVLGVSLFVWKKKSGKGE